MAGISEQFHCRSLTTACLTLVLVPLAAGSVILWPPLPSQGFLIEATVLALFGISACAAGYTNLVHEESRGYSRDRCAIAAVLLLLAIAPHCVLVFLLVQHFLAK